MPAKFQPPRPTFFATPAKFRAWLEKNHATKQELWVGYYKKASGKRSMTWSESVDQALCFGWIDGIRKSVDDSSYANRFTPRRPGSNWSEVNVKRAHELVAAGLMRPAGAKAFEARIAGQRPAYSFTPELEQEFRRNGRAWAFFEAQPLGYRKLATLFVVSAKKDETRRRRLAQLIADSEAGRRIGILEREPKAKR